MAISNHLHPFCNILKFALTTLIILAVLGSSTVAQPPMLEQELKTAPSPSPDCMELLLNISDCLRYVETGSNLTEPDKGCCPELAGLVESNPICLCQLLGSPGRKSGLRIEIKKALQLPSLCKVESPPTTSFCEAAGIPVGSPIASEGPSPASPDDMSEGLAASPSTTNDDNGGFSPAITTLRLFAFLTSAAIVFLQIYSG
ncbi:hypothetical protein LIER_07908 [Lithospermum erythrorhizon]|uniref:Bifunctional inhibitor/plant lipid transfer protein/seed storage helical domain-containing protein n=1 Tax=Lithospermum erythrorhizon TaxID=34254 RepID=A0AAV3PCP7_LITER